MKTKDLANIIKKRRKEQKLTQSQLAGLSNVGVRFIVDLEAGKETCQVGKVLYILEMLGIKLDIDGKNYWPVCIVNNLRIEAVFFHWLLRRISV